MGVLERILQNLIARLDGPLHFRFVFQPLMATIWGVVDGVKDARAGKPAYFWAVLFSPKSRDELIKHGWKSIGKIFILAIILDSVYQMEVHSTIYAGELLIVAFTLAILPYLLVRGPVNRIVRLFRRQVPGDAGKAKIADVTPGQG
ncbi:MAG: hypothetical protein WCA15_02640 [Candidatus Acidiferrales bacterium]